MITFGARIILGSCSGTCKMSPEVCPFCGKTFKRLKAHLPHCKAAAHNPPTEQNDSTNQKTSSPLLSTGVVLSKTSAKGTKSRKVPLVAAEQQTKMSKKESNITPPLTENTTQSSTLLSSPSSNSPPSAKKKKQKLTDYITAATVPSSPPLSVSLPEPEEKRIQSLAEASKSKQFSNGSPQGTRSAFVDLLTNSTISRATPQTETKANPDKVPHNTSLSSNTKPTRPLKKRSKDKATQAVPTTEASSASLDSKGKEDRPRPCAGDTNWLCEENKEDLPGIESFWSPGNGHQARIILQDVKAALGRSKGSSQSSRLDVFSKIKTDDDLSSNNRQGMNPDPAPVGNRTNPAAPSDWVSCTSSQPVERTANKNKKETRTCEFDLQDDGSRQQELNSAHSVRSHYPLPLVSQLKALTTIKGVKVGHHMAEVLPTQTSLTQTVKERAAESCSRSVFPVVQRSGAARVDTWRSSEGMTNGRPLLEFGKINTADNATEDTLTRRTLGQVRLNELPEWLASKTPRSPRDIVEMAQRGWQWYYRRYIDVKKGGVGGVSMLLVGYCVLSYIWSYPHIKRDRWRKYH
ncbi:uncharacterized protein si:dkey-21c1.4 [Thalassophryne amazonica]|uniref:uncharacterized protein si:dkey-21c1.4 n=1 Tax=Thalassophryne amazonica TaxID=390379 RepID=UPI001471EACB|nr:uncharacterized protein si:dkey-21c1.4 [Thalassophryne amazonica]